MKHQSWMNVFHHFQHLFLFQSSTLYRTVLLLSFISVSVLANTQSVYTLDFSNSQKRSDGSTELLTTPQALYNAIDLSLIKQSDTIRVQLPDETIFVSNVHFNQTKGHHHKEGIIEELDIKIFTIRNTDQIFHALISNNVFQATIISSGLVYTLSQEDTGSILIEQEPQIEPLTFFFPDKNLTIGISNDQTFRQQYANYADEIAQLVANSEYVLNRFANFNICDFYVKDIHLTQETLNSSHFTFLDYLGGLW